MAKQNIYDNALFSMMSDLNEKRVLDLGCGFGEHCKIFVDNVKKYHRTFSTIINTLIEAGFTIEKMIEPLPTEELLCDYPPYKDLFHKPDFLLIKVKK